MRYFLLFIFTLSLSQNALAIDEDSRSKCEELLAIAQAAWQHESYSDLSLTDLDRDIVYIVRMIDLEQGGYDVDRGGKGTIDRFNAVFPALEALIIYDIGRRNHIHLGLIYVNAIEAALDHQAAAGSRVAWLRNHIQRRLDYLKSLPKPRR
jgi:hypothetical protein